MPQRTVVQRFWDNVDPNGPLPSHAPELGPCWVWTAGRSTGNGPSAYGAFGKRAIRAHRFAYALFVYTIPAGQEIHHRCRNGLCVRPDHLESLTPLDHNKVHQGDRPDLRTHCKYGHEFTEENTYVSPKRGQRNCRKCLRRARLEWRARQRALGLPG